MKKLYLFFLAILLFNGSLLSAKAASPFLVDADWVAERMDDPKLIVLEVRYHPHRYYTVGHIPGARQVQRFKDLGDNNAKPIMRFPSRQAFQTSLRRWGVNDDSIIVIYDDARTALAARLYYLLDLYGYDMSRVKVLNGGTIEWTVFNELEKTAPKVTEGTVTLKPADKALYVEWTEIYDRVISQRDPTVVLLDARPFDHYTGDTIQHSMRGGHIPGAINIVSQQGTDPQTHKWFSETELAELYQALPRNKTVFAYCHDGFRMSQAYLQLKHLGYADVRLYNGGWGHWGNTLALPVVQGDQPLNEEYQL